MGLALHSEVWEKKEKKAHLRKIDELFHMDGISYISTVGGEEAVQLHVMIKIISRNAQQYKYLQ